MPLINILNKNAMTDVNYQNFYNLFEYELHNSRRYNRHISLAILSILNVNQESLLQLARRNFRLNDRIFLFDEEIFILLPKANESGAKSALGRFLSLLDGRTDCNFSITTFPTEGNSVNELVEIGYRKLVEYGTEK